MANFTGFPKFPLCFKFNALIQPLRDPAPNSLIKDTISLAHYSIEIRKLFEGLQIGAIKRTNSLGASILKRINDKLSLAGELEIVDYNWKKPNLTFGMLYANDKHKFCAEYIGKEEKQLSIGYAYSHNDRIGFATEHIENLGKKMSDTRVGFRLRFLEGEIRGSLSSNLVVSSEISHIIDKMILVRIFGNVDFLEKTQPVFGISFDIGSLAY